MTSKNEGSSDESSTDKPKQPELSYEPQYEVHDGVEHEFSGTLYVPTQREIEKQEKAEAEKPMSVVGSKPVIFIPEQPRGNRFAKTRDDFTKVKLNPLLALRLRAKGQ